MSFKKVNKLLEVSPLFFENIIVQVTDVQPLYDYVDGKRSERQTGIKVEVVILDDRFPGYESNTNQFEKFVVKERGEMNIRKYTKGVKAKVLSTKASFYGDGYAKNLSVEGQLKLIAINK